MPGEDAYSFITKLRARPRERGGIIPAAALTAYARAQDRRRALQAGFQMHIGKPVEPSELAVVVAALARGQLHEVTCGKSRPRAVGAQPWRFEHTSLGSLKATLV